MNRDEFRGAARHVKGRATTAIGAVAGDAGRQVRGAIDQVAGGAHYAYGRARRTAGQLADDGRYLAEEARDRAGNLIHEGRHLARHTRKRGEDYGRQAIGYADDNRTLTLVALAVVAFGLGWLSRPAHDRH